MTTADIVAFLESDPTGQASVEFSYHVTPKEWLAGCHAYDIKHADPADVCEECSYVHDGDWTICRGCGFRKAAA